MRLSYRFFLALGLLFALAADLAFAAGLAGLLETFLTGVFSRYCGFSLALGARFGGNNGSCCGSRGGFATSSFRGRWRRRWRGRGRERFQELQSLSSRAQLPIQKHQEDIIGNLGIRRELRRNVQLSHLRKRNFLLDLSPLGEEVLNLLDDGLLARGDREEQNHFRPRRRQQLPGSRRRRCLLAR